MSGQMTVTRVFTDHGSHIEPPLDQSWSPLEKLQWHAAVVAMDTGLRIEVRNGEAWQGDRRIWDYYMLTVSGDSHSTGTGGSFLHLWSELNGISIGAKAAGGVA